LKRFILLKIWFRKIFPFFDFILFFILLFSIPGFLFFARYGGKKLSLSRRLLKKSGIYPIRNHYYYPLFKDSILKKSLREPRNLPGIDFVEKKQLRFLERLTYSNELKDMNLDESKFNIVDFDINNITFKSGDAEFLYQIIRFLRPKRIIEIGSGNSTKLANKALKRNYLETQQDFKHICIEPYEMPWLESLDVEVIRSLVEDCDTKIFDSLENNDLLFIDSSHIIRPQGDVLKEYLEIIPRLNSGVVIHVHDIFTPRDYLDEWIREEVFFWNEQYLLECLLSNTERYEILAALNFLKHTNYSDLQRVCPYLTVDREPGSIYFKVK
tara:strand:- start:89 stop:1066 length:978 start_codon:yes stop_codon:yes gene_type:complete